MDNQTDTLRDWQAHLDRQARIDRLTKLRDQCLMLELELNLGRAEQLEPAIIAKLEAQLDPQGRQLLKELLSYHERVAIYSIAQLAANIKTLEGEITFLNKDLNMLEIEALKWQFIFAETLRLYGEKQGKLGDMLKKAYERIYPDAVAYAYDPEGHTWVKEFLTKVFGEEFINSAIDRDRKKKIRDFQKTYDQEAIINRYSNLTGYPRRKATTEDLAYRKEEEVLRGPFLEKRLAIEIIAKEFNFPSWRAAFDFLKRQGQKNLPADYPEV